MPTEEQIRDLAYRIWEQEGKPEGKHLEHYFRARQILEDQEAARERIFEPKSAMPQPPTRGRKRATRGK